MNYYKQKVNHIAPQQNNLGTSIKMCMLYFDYLSGQGSVTEHAK